MTITNLINRSIQLLFLALLLTWPTLPSNAADQVQGAMILAPVDSLGTVASGAVGDSLKACLERIPDTATAGQRMLAEQNCKGEEANRKLVQLPTF